MWWGLFLLSFFSPASQSHTQTWPRVGGRTGGVGRAPASRTGRPELWEMEAQAVTQEDTPPENRRLEDIPLECRDQRIHGSLWKELEWVSHGKTSSLLLGWCGGTFNLLQKCFVFADFVFLIRFWVCYSWFSLNEVKSRQSLTIFFCFLKKMHSGII